MPGRRDSADERLRAYRAKRDFSITAEPAGTAPPAANGWRFVVQRHRASRLHYDLRLEAGGVLVSWAVPKGPTLDPAARRLAVHVEDHPLDYYDFEGVIAAGEYGGGDVIVWDWGTWALAEGDDALAEIAAGDLHLALHGDKLRGRFALVRRGTDGREQWLLIKKRDEDAVAGWDPEAHPRSVKSGRTNDEVRTAPAASWSGQASWAGPTADELAALDALGRAGTWSLGGRELHLTDLDAPVVPGRGRGRPLTKRDLVRHHAVMAPVVLPYLADRPVEGHRRARGAGRAIVEVPVDAPDWLRRWRDRDADRGHPRQLVVPDSAAALVFLAELGAVELRPWISTVDDPHAPTWALFHIEPGRREGAATTLELARLHRTALAHLGVEGRPVLTGARAIQIWVPVARGATFARTRQWVDAVAQAIGASVPDLVDRESGGARGGGHAHLDTTQNAFEDRLVTPFGPRHAPGGPVAVPIGWDELDDDRLRADHWTVRNIGARLRRDGDPLAPLIGAQQRLPAL